MPSPPSSSIGPGPVEAEVRANILAQRVAADEPAAGSVADFNLPEPLLSRIVDRVVRSSFEERHRSVFEDRPGRGGRVEAGAAPRDVEHWPPLRGYRAPLAPGDPAWPEHFPAPSDPPELRRAAEHVVARLATDGLAATLAEVCHILGPLMSVPEARLDLLRRAGLPADLLDCFSVEGTPLWTRMAAQVDRGGTAAELREVAARAVFGFRPVRAGFRAAADTGTHACALVRLQMTRAGHWKGEGGGRGSGDNFDVLRQLLEKLPAQRFVVSIEAAHAEALRAEMGAAVSGAPDRVALIPTELPGSQWAQDNLKPGQGPKPVALAPRFATRAEDGAKLAPGDTAVLRALAGAGIEVVQSPLHFQGGNLVIAEEGGGGRLLLVGEADVARNVALGLSAEQALEALRLEMGATRASVLPAVSFHLDYEVSPRLVDGRLVAFVNDERAGTRLIIGCALRALEHAGAFSRADARILRTFLEQGNDDQVLARLGGVLRQVARPDGSIPASFADLFRTAPPTPGESGIGNLSLVLLALDLLGARRVRSWEAELHPHARAYLNSLRRREADRGALHAQLVALGFELVPLPGLAHDARSATPVNAVHLPGRVLVPVRSGLLRPLDEAALAIMRRRLPGVEVVPIVVAESERRGGSLHCSVCMFPDPNAS